MQIQQYKKMLYLNTQLYFKVKQIFLIIYQIYPIIFLSTLKNKSLKIIQFL